MTRARVAGTLLALSSVAGSAAAQDAAATGARREIHETLGTGLNPLGLQDGLDVSWRWPLSHSTRALVSDAHLSLGLEDRLSPAYDRLGGFVELAPLSIFDVRVGLEPVFYFGTFSAMLGLPGYDAPFDDHALDGLRADGKRVSGFGARAYVAPTAKMKVGRVIARAHAEFEWWRTKSPGAPFFYEPTRDTLLEARGDSLIVAEEMVVYELRQTAGAKVLLGPMHTLTRVWAAPQNQKQDVGLLALVGLGARRLGMTEPTIFARVFYYLQSPNRRHQVSAQVALGFNVGH